MSQNDGNTISTDNFGTILHSSDKTLLQQKMDIINIDPDHQLFSNSKNMNYFINEYLKKKKKSPRTLKYWLIHSLCLFYIEVSQTAFV